MSRTLGILIGGLAALWSAGLCEAATMVDGKPNNPYGVQIAIDPRGFSDYCNINWKWASDLCGEWGYVRIGSGVHSGDPEEPIRGLAYCRAYKLIPVMTGLYVPDEYRDPEGGGDAEPYLRKDGYPLAAARYGEWARRLAEVGAEPPFYEIGNEINGKWHPERYGYFVTAMSQAMKRELPNLQIVTAGLAGHGGQFLEDAIRAVPEMKDHVDCYGLHPYAINRPPSYGKGDYCIRGYEWTARHLARVGVENPKFVMTESGYEIGNRKDPDYPTITDSLRAKYLVEAYRDWWGPDPRVVMLSIFWLHSTTYPGWDGWVLINTDGTPTETYRALAAVEKPEGSDWMEGGPGRITGVVRDARTGQAIERVVAYTIPGIHAGVTGEDGAFVIEDLPAGEYTVHAFRDGFASPQAAKVTADGKTNGSVAFAMQRTGLIHADLGGGPGPIANHWNAIEASPPAAHYAVDKRVRRQGEGSTRLTARPGEAVGVWQCSDYSTAVPDRPYAAEIRVRGEGLKRGNGKGVVFTVSITDPFAHALSSAQVTLPPDLEGDFDWMPLSATVAPYPAGRRIVLKCELEAEAGTVWFDDAYLHYAEYPTPSRLDFADSGPGVIRGEVLGRSGLVTGQHPDGSLRGERFGGATVCLRPGNFWTYSRLDGTYELTDIPAGVYDVWAHAQGWSSASAFQVTVGEDPVQLDLMLPKIPAATTVLNGDFELAGLETADVPHWTRFGEFDGSALSGWHKGTGIPGLPDGVLARSGEAFLGCVSGSNVKNGGFHQIVAVEPGKTYEVSAWVYTWQTEDGRVGDVSCRIGLDPYGERDPESHYVLWTPWRPSHGEWSRISIKARAITDRMTVFLGALQAQGLVFNVNVFDDVEFVEAREDLPAAQAMR